EDLAAEACSPALRAAIDAVLYRTAILLEEARPLPPLIMHRGLRLQAAITFAVAERQLAMLRRHDPLAQRLRLSRWDRAATLVTGLWRGLLC
ncbi:MAG: squalene/phytoene synthase family protein, partial [Rhodospirillales bacterium]|nr:squalene/phytoene synthase family protein [Rhodospirillales bacterium]